MNWPGLEKRIYCDLMRWLVPSFPLSKGLPLDSDAVINKGVFFLMTVMRAFVTSASLERENSSSLNPFLNKIVGILT